MNGTKASKHPAARSSLLLKNSKTGLISGSWSLILFPSASPPIIQPASQRPPVFYTCTSQPASIQARSLSLSLSTRCRGQQHLHSSADLYAQSHIFIIQPRVDASSAVHFLTCIIVSEWVRGRWSILPSSLPAGAGAGAGADACSAHKHAKIWALSFLLLIHTVDLVSIYHKNQSVALPCTIGWATVTPLFVVAVVVVASGDGCLKQWSMRPTWDPCMLSPCLASCCCCWLRNQDHVSACDCEEGTSCVGCGTMDGDVVWYSAAMSPATLTASRESPARPRRVKPTE